MEEKLQPGDVILTRDHVFQIGTLPIKIANFFKKGYRDRGWTHAALFIGNGEVVEAFPGGIVRRKFKDSYLNGKFDLLALRCKKIDSQAIAEVISVCTSVEGQKYDKRALIYFALYNFIPQGWHFLLEKNFWGDCFNVNDSYFCSELVATCFQKANAYCFENPPYKVMPIDFYNDIWFSVVDRQERQQGFNWIKDSFFFLCYLIAGVICPFLLIISAVLIFVLVFAVVLAASKDKKAVNKTA